MHNVMLSSCMMYKQNVVPCNKLKYTKAGDEVIDSGDYDYTSADGKKWICTACDHALS